MNWIGGDSWIDDDSWKESDRIEGLIVLLCKHVTFQHHALGVGEGGIRVVSLLDTVHEFQQLFVGQGDWGFLEVGVLDGGKGTWEEWVFRRFLSLN